LQALHLQIPQATLLTLVWIRTNLPCRMEGINTWRVVVVQTF
jgi:hypothetical protein